MFQNLEDEALCSELVSIQLPDSEHALHAVINHLSVAVSGVLFFESKIAWASSTDPTLSNLYILRPNSSTSFIFFWVSSPSPSHKRGVRCSRDTFPPDFFEWLHMKDVVSPQGGILQEPLGWGVRPTL